MQFSSNVYCTLLSLIFSLYTMSSIITGVLSSTLGLLWNKARDATAESLKGCLHGGEPARVPELARFTKLF